MSYTTTFTAPSSPEEVYAAVLDVRSWWTGDITRTTDELGKSFTYRYEDKHQSTHQITELVPGKRVVWLTTDSHLPFASDPSEWTDTEISFDLTRLSEGTELRFTHAGLVPEVECYEACSGAWSWYIDSSLRDRVNRMPAST